MMRGGKTLVYIIAGLVLGTGAKAVTADSADNPYHGIVDRNLFNLKPPTPPPGPEANKPPAPKITLTGITTILGYKQVGLLVATRPGQPPESYIMTEGQGREGVEVLQIDEKAGTVRVRNHGEEQTLDFVNNGAKPATGPGMPVPLGMPAFPTQPGRLPLPMNNGNSALKSIPTRPERFPPASNTGAAGGGMNAQAQSTTPALTPEEQTIMIEAQRMDAHQRGDPIEKILPPTELTPEVNAGETQ
jgi:hypothetical protein